MRRYPAPLGARPCPFIKVLVQGVVVVENVFAVLKLVLVRLSHAVIGCTGHVTRKLRGLCTIAEWTPGNWVMAPRLGAQYSETTFLPARYTEAGKETDFVPHPRTGQL